LRDQDTKVDEEEEELRNMTDKQLEERQML
jgi:hypothetical protein